MSYCENFLYCDNESCAKHHYKRNNVEQRIRLSNVKTSLLTELEPYLEKQKKGVAMCHFGDMCFNNEKDCKFNHWYVLDGRKKLKKAFTKAERHVKIASEIEAMRNGYKSCWADM
jgi:hypothetical protein